MGHLDDSRYLAAIAMGSVLFSTLIWLVAFIKVSTIGLTAQSVGRNTPSETKTILVQSLLYATVISITILLLQQIILKFAYLCLSPPSETVHDLTLYYQIRIWGFPANFITFVAIGWFIGVQATRTPMIITIATNLLNATLNYLFVYHLDLGTAGVAWGTLISEYVGLCIAISAIMVTFKQYSGSICWASITSLSSYIQLNRSNRDYFIRTLFLLSTFLFFTRQGVHLGKDYVAVNELLKSFLLIIALALDGFAHAAEALAGAAWGKRDRDTFFLTIKVTAQWSIITASLLTLLFALFSSPLIELLTSIPSIILLANQYLLWIIPLPLVSVWCFLFDGILVGTTSTTVMRNNMIFSTLFVFLPLIHLTPLLGNHAIWLAMWGLFIARGIGLGWHVYRNFYLGCWHK